MATEQIEVEIVLDDGSIRKGFTKINKQSQKTGKKIGSSLAAGLGKASLALAGFGAAIAGAFAVRKVIAAASAQEEAINKINIALANTGKLTEGASQGMQDFASELQKVTTIGDETTLETAALIQSLGDLEVDGLKRATVAAADLSAALGIDLKAAALLVGKAAAGEVSSFSRYGLIIRKGANSAETFEKALTALEKKFGGAAQAQVNTFAGRLQQLENSFGDLLEEIGFVITSSPALLASFKFISESIFETTDGIKNLRESKGDPFGDIIKGAIDLGLALNNFVIMPFEVVASATKVALNGIKLAVQTIVAGLAEASAKIISFFAPDSELAKNLNLFKESTAEVFQEFESDAASSVLSFGNVDIASQTETFLQGLRSAVAQADPLTGALKNQLNSVGETLGEVAISGKSKMDFLKKGLVAGFTALGGALAKGEDGFAAFGKAILGIIGDMAIQIGTTLLTIGLGIEKLKASLTTLSGGFAIAAGLALIAVGGALKALSGGGGIAGAATGAGGGAVGGETFGDTTVGPSEAEIENLEENKAAVTVNVDGTVLDPQSVGLQIAEVLNEAGFGSGAVIA